MAAMGRLSHFSQRFVALRAALLICACCAGPLPGFAEPGVAEVLPPLAAQVEPLFAPPVEDAPPENQLWMICTRGLDDEPACGAPFSPAISRFRCGSGWTESSELEFLAEDHPGRVTVFLVHGNDTTEEEALDGGNTIYKLLTASDRCRRACGASPPVRLVIWSWPSTQMLCSLRRDARTKAERTETESYYLARAIDQLRPDQPISLLGYSFGARILVGSLHVLGGGEIDGRTLPARTYQERMPIRSVLLGAALDNDWLQPGAANQFALSQSDRMLILINPRDIALRFYPKLYPHRGPDALGLTGVQCPQSLGAEMSKVLQESVTDYVGARHSWDIYVKSAEIMARVKLELLFQ
jgi:hypothetical protein